MPAALCCLLLCDRMVVERVWPPNVSLTLALGLPMSRTAAPPPAPAGGLLGPCGTQLGWASAAEPDRASTHATIVEVLSMAFLLSRGRAGEEEKHPAGAALHRFSHPAAVLPHLNRAPRGAKTMLAKRTLARRGEWSRGCGSCSKRSMRPRRGAPTGTSPWSRP